MKCRSIEVSVAFSYFYPGFKWGGGSGGWGAGSIRRGRLYSKHYSICNRFFLIKGTCCRSVHSDLLGIFYLYARK